MSFVVAVNPSTASAAASPPKIIKNDPIAPSGPDFFDSSFLGSSFFPSLGGGGPAGDSGGGGPVGGGGSFGGASGGAPPIASASCRAPPRSFSCTARTNASAMFF